MVFRLKSQGVFDTSLPLGPSLYSRIGNRLWRSFYDFKDKVHQFGNTAALDYPGADIRIIADTFRERSIRANSSRKEPGTVRWLEENTSPSSVLYDIGANIGAYSLIAAARGSKVLAFEPAYQNFFQLNRNVSLNRQDERIACFQVAFSRSTKVGQFQFLETTPGTSKCFYNEKNEFHLKQQPVLAKSVMVFSLDDFVELFHLPLATAIKIDVDGAESDVVFGARKTFSNPHLQTVIVEIDQRNNPTSEILEFIESCGHKTVSEEKFPKSVSNFILKRVSP